MAEFSFRLLDSMADVEADAWHPLYRSSTEGFDYLHACEQAPAPGFRYSAIGVFDGESLVAGAPVFHTVFDPRLFLDGKAKSAFNVASRALPAISRVPTFGLGSPHTHDTNIGFHERLSTSERCKVLARLADALEDLAKAASGRIVLFKDIDNDLASWGHDTLQRAGFARATSLPVAILPVPETEEIYFASLSGNMRSNLRRRLKRAKNIKVEIRDNCDGLGDQLIELRRNTMGRAAADFAQFAGTSTQFYEAILTGMPQNARLLTYWLDDTLIGFAMALIEKDKLFQTYNGMRYPEGPDNGLFYLDWMTQLRLCLDNGITELQSGITTYLIKARLGCQFHRRYLYVRHRYRAINSVIGALASSVNLETGDPGIVELGQSAPFVVSAA